MIENFETVLLIVLVCVVVVQLLMSVVNAVEMVLMKEPVTVLAM